jgi:hypothetical protein
MPKKTVLFLILLIISVPQLFVVKQAFAKNKQIKLFTKAGYKETQCPRHIANLKSGLLTSILLKDTACYVRAQNSVVVDSKKNNKKKKKPIKFQFVPFPLNGKLSLGRAFDKIEDQEGDVRTEPFVIGNFPAIISYAVKGPDEESSSNISNFKLVVENVETGKLEYVLYRADGSVTGEFVVSNPGSYILRAVAKGGNLGKDQGEFQPSFTVSIRFMAAYRGKKISPNLLREFGKNVVKCPEVIADRTSDNLVQINSDYRCFGNVARDDLESVGFVYAPYNFSRKLFLSKVVEYEGEGDHVWLPFRIERSTDITYSISDPAEGRGDTTFQLINLNENSKDLDQVEVSGSISNTLTKASIVGDYYIFVSTRPYQPKKNGDIEWSYTVNIED